MEIKIEVSQAELDEMGVTAEAFPARIIEQLDEATLSSGRASAEWPNYWVTVNITNDRKTTMSTGLLSRPTIRTIVKAMTAQDLATCAQDVILWQDKGVLADGPLHALAARFVVELGIDEMSSLQQAEAAVLREASLRFTAAQTGLRAAQR